MIRKALPPVSASVLLAALLSPNLLAEEAISEATTTESTARENKEIKKEPVDQLISCTMKLVHNRKGNEQELQQLAYMIQAAITEEVNENSIQTYVQQCQNLDQSLADMPKAPKKEYLSWIEELPANKGTRKLFTGFVQPTHQCYTFGIHNSFGWLGHGVLGGSLGADIAGCRGSLGHIWFELRPYGELTTGLGSGYRWGFHMGKERNPSSQPAKNIHLRASVDFSAFIGMHFSLTGHNKKEGLTFSLHPSLAFGGGGGVNIPFGLKAEVYGHLKKTVLEPNLTSSL